MVHICTITVFSDELLPGMYSQQHSANVYPEIIYHLLGSSHRPLEGKRSKWLPHWPS